MTSMNTQPSTTTHPNLDCTKTIFADASCATYDRRIYYSIAIFDGRKNKLHRFVLINPRSEIKKWRNSTYAEACAAALATSIGIRDNSGFFYVANDNISNIEAAYKKTAKNSRPEQTLDFSLPSTVRDTCLKQIQRKIQNQTCDFLYLPGHKGSKSSYISLIDAVARRLTRRLYCGSSYVKALIEINRPYLMELQNLHYGGEFPKVEPIVLFESMEDFFDYVFQSEYQLSWRES